LRRLKRRWTVDIADPRGHGSIMWLGDHDPDAVAWRLADVAAETGRLLRSMEADRGEPRIKDDGSPTTAADLAAEKLIIARLSRLWPGVPVVAEETANDAAPGDAFFLVDPLDGTRDFLHGTGEYTVNIALVAGSRPVAAVVAAPVPGRIWAAGATAMAGDWPAEGGEIAWRSIRVRPAPPDGLVALVSRRHNDDATEACLATLSIRTRRTASSALKFCLIASGEADVYVRCGPTMEWDTAAGDHILSCAGGCVIAAGGAPMTYGRQAHGYRNGAFAAIGDPALARRLSLPVAPVRG
jgi:3'(2'), 5'-bisphosphate nucleotidase